ncbi:MAG: galactokinase [Geodermatophilaceae bacterium]
METAAAAEFTRAYGRPPAGVWAAPGRVNLIGEHTDYNDGFVLPMALHRQVVVAAAPAAGRSTVRSRQQADVAEFRAVSVEPADVAGWAAYVAGVAWALRSDGYAVPDADFLVDSDIPVGAGLSSSAALGCAVARAMIDLAELDVHGTELALLVRRAENDFVGAPTGLMDQLASIHGRAGHVVFVDTRSLVVEQVPFVPAAHGLTLLVADTRARHQLVDGQYAQRRQTCRSAARALGVPALRDVPMDDLEEAVRRLPGQTMRRRLRHVVTENARVLDVVSVLRSGRDLRAIGPVLSASHASLRDDFEVTVPQLDVAVDSALAAGAYGARMTGGGFGGSIIALLDSRRRDEVVTAVENALQRCGFDPPATFTAAASPGARRLS